MNILKVQEVANILRISKLQVYRLIDSGKLKATIITVGDKRRHFRILQENLDEFIRKETR